MRSTIVRSVLASVVMLSVVAVAPAGARAACPAVPANSPLSAHAAKGEPLLVALTPLTPKCYDRAAENRFRDRHSELGAQRGIAGSKIRLAVANIEDANSRGGGCAADDNRQYTTAKARVVLNKVIPEAQTAVDDMEENLISMDDSAIFALQNQDVYHSLKSSVRYLRQAINRAGGVIHDLKTAAQSLAAFDCQSAHVTASVAQNMWGDIEKELGVGTRAIATHLRAFAKAPCKDFAPQGAPLSPGQISSFAGGGGSQRASAGALTVTAPRRLKVKIGSRLPLSLSTSAQGFVRLELARGRTTITGVSALINRGRGSVRVSLPKGASRGVAKLYIVFVRSHHTWSKTLSVKVV